MTNLNRLKADRDICYTLACAAYGQEYVNELLHEGDEINDESIRRINEVRGTLTPIKYVGQLDEAKSLRDAAKSFHGSASIRDLPREGRANENADGWYLQ